jgi:GAF domain-containing protein
MGNLQLVGALGTLRIVTQHGFGDDFLEHFAVVDGDGSACGRALRHRAQTAITDVRADPGFAPHRRIAAASGFRAVQSTPLVGPDGRVWGIVSTHFRGTRELPARDLQLMEWYGEHVGAVLARQAGAPRPGGARSNGDRAEARR